MIDKEIFELLDAISREKGEPMSPFEELMILGYYPEKREHVKNDIDEEEDYDDFTREDEENGEAEEEYEFDEDDEAYTLLSDILCRNNDRKKYFA
jgi:hypothetical protein